MVIAKLFPLVGGQVYLLIQSESTLNKSNITIIRVVAVELFALVKGQVRLLIRSEVAG